MILYKKVPGKKSFYIEKWMGIKDAYNFTTMGKKRLDNKTPLAILNMQMHRRKVLFYENVSDLTSFLQDLELFFLVFFFGFIFLITLIPVNVPR